MSERHDRSSFLGELKRRRVVRVGIGYAAAVFVVLQAAELVFDALDIADSVFRALVIVSLSGFPVALLLGWLLDVTPEGVRVTARPGEAGRLLARVPPWLLYAPVALLLLSAVAFAVALNAPQAAGGAVEPGAEVIAVIPFNVSGSGVGLTGEGFVDLLSRNLDQVGGVRTVDSRTVLYRWERRDEGAALEPTQEARRIGSEVRAGSVLTGSAVVLGTQVRLSADLYPVDGTTKLASAVVEGDSQHLLELVDSLSIALLREIWRSSRPLPRTDVRAITSGDIDAIRSFLRGEQHYRASAWDSALIWFARAVAEDSIFPLAHYRLAMTAGWSGDGGMASAGASSAALYYSDRLPPREQLLVRVMGLRGNGDAAMARDTLRAYLNAYPDDAEAWFLLADDEYHLQHESVAPIAGRVEETLVLFDRVLNLDPSFTPALIHPLEIAFRTGNRTLIEQYTALLSAVVPAGSGAQIYRAAAVALATRDADALGSAFAAAVAAGDSSSIDLSRQASIAVMQPLLASIIALPSAERARALETFRGSIGPAHRDAAAAAVAHVRIAVGQLDEARTLLAPLARDPHAGGQVRLLERLPVYSGVADSSAIGRMLNAPDVPGAHVLRLVAAIDARDVAAVQSAARGLRDFAQDSVWRVLAEAGDAFATLLAGDTIAGLAQIQATLPRRGFVAGSVHDALWFRWVELLAEHPQTRARAVELLRVKWQGEPALELQRQYVLGRALEASGDPGNARIAYTVFITAVGEPNALAGPLRERALAARAALARLGSLRPSTSS